MKPLEKLTKAQFISFCLMSFCSGVMIGVGGTAFLLACNWNETWGKLVGSVLFSLGILSIVMFEMKLFTGLISDIPEMGAKNFWKLPVCFLGNMLGVLFASILVYYSPLKDSVVPQAKILMSVKLDAHLWALKAFCSAILCGFLITLSIGAVNYAPRKKLSTTVGVMFPIIVFAFCGFDHSVANTLYIYFLGFSGKAVVYLLMCVLGNIVGGVILPILSLFRIWSNTPQLSAKAEEKQENPTDTSNE
ncbi:MAG: formate/nitrite transporter family protein [Clostridiales bacterium]|nr:formate/nitrite transporter family protein [Clostridiales bacterium]